MSFHQSLHDTYRQLGLTESQARHVSSDRQASQPAYKVVADVSAGRLTLAEADRQLRDIVQAALARPAGSTWVQPAPTATRPRRPAAASVQEASSKAAVEVIMARRLGREPAAWATPSALQESAGTLTRTRLLEAATATTTAGARLRVRLIAPGQGSSGYYPPEVLKRDGPKVFVAGTQSFLDHPTASESYDRPERSVRDLAGRLAAAATWQDQGPLGAGLYGDIDVFPHVAPLLASIGPHIGVSIRADGEIDPAGKVTALSQAHSVDFVTRAGAGGAVVT